MYDDVYSWFGCCTGTVITDCDVYTACVNSRSIDDCLSSSECYDNTLVTGWCALPSPFLTQETANKSQCRGLRALLRNVVQCHLRQHVRPLWVREQEDELRNNVLSQWGRRKLVCAGDGDGNSVFYGVFFEQVEHCIY